jgi:hypothetical protein
LFIILSSSLLSRFVDKLSFAALLALPPGERERNSKHDATILHRHSPQVNASVDPLHLEDEGISVQELEDRSGQEEVPG